MLAPSPDVGARGLSTLWITAVHEMTPVEFHSCEPSHIHFRVYFHCVAIPSPTMMNPKPTARFQPPRCCIPSTPPLEK